MIRIASLLIASFAFFTFQVTAQHHHDDDGARAEKYCDTDKMEEEWLLKNAEHRDEIEAAKAELERLTENFESSEHAGRDANYIIPVVFHIVHAGGSENISNEQVEDAIRIMSEDFQLLNSDISSVIPEFEDLVADVGVEFRLARIDPQGNCTNGIVRTFSNETFEGGENLKDISPTWTRSKYMNIWVAANLSGGAAGYTYTPGSVDGFWGAQADGIVINHTYVGSIGTGSPTRSRALTHEVGHWINLRHPWGGSNNPGLPENCGSDDNVSDTPNTIGWTSCTLSGESCGSLDNVQNFMEYSYCSRMFTQGQRTRMLAALNSSVASRNNLHSNNNLVSTGVLGDGPLCATEIIASKTEICAGDSVIYTDQSYHNITSRTWTFEGGNPSTATAQQVVVYYNEPGVFDVELEVSNGSETIAENYSNQIEVLPLMGESLPVVEDFESISSLSEDWTLLETGTSQTWQLANNVSGASGNSAIKLPNRYLQAGDLSEIWSNPIDLSNTNTDVTISFKYAYARRNPGNSERLKFWVSNDCGETWSLRGIWTNNFETVPFTSLNWHPSEPAHWETVVIDNLSSNQLVSNFRFKFEFESDGGNNFFIDDINIVGPDATSIDEVDISSQVEVFPNPAREQVNLHIAGESGYSFNYQLVNTLGQSVYSRENVVFGGGTEQYQINTSSFSPGVYILNIQTDKGKRAVKRIMLIR